ncbi:uncharacterized protein IL334_005814 [Kwoniella shivajii]|uniref:Uncharacterized protein n=1 Tax=Kwoniella shivajii TaxID=564305 RepID=A0ABZ1D4V4_9TREE|nr:hypothetical protein IL334_005814 [Kwoniella shivajii]
MPRPGLKIMSGIRWLGPFTMNDLAKSREETLARRDREEKEVLARYQAEKARQHNLAISGESNTAAPPEVIFRSTLTQSDQSLVFVDMTKRSRPDLKNTKMNDWYNDDKLFNSDDLFESAAFGISLLPGFLSMSQSARDNLADAFSILLSRAFYLNRWSEEFNPNEKTILMKDLYLRFCALAIDADLAQAYRKDADEEMRDLQDLLIDVRGLRLGMANEVEPEAVSHNSYRLGLRGYRIRHVAKHLRDTAHRKYANNQSLSGRRRHPGTFESVHNEAFSRRDTTSRRARGPESVTYEKNRQEA